MQAVTAPTRPIAPLYAYAYCRIFFTSLALHHTTVGHRCHLQPPSHAVPEQVGKTAARYQTHIAAPSLRFGVDDRGDVVLYRQ